MRQFETVTFNKGQLEYSLFYDIEAMNFKITYLSTLGDENIYREYEDLIDAESNFYLLKDR